MKRVRSDTSLTTRDDHLMAKIAQHVASLYQTNPPPAAQLFGQGVPAVPFGGQPSGFASFGTANQPGSTPWREPERFGQEETPIPTFGGGQFGQLHPRFGPSPVPSEAAPSEAASIPGEVTESVEGSIPLKSLFNRKTKQTTFNLPDLPRPASPFKQIRKQKSNPIFTGSPPKPSSTVKPTVKPGGIIDRSSAAGSSSASVRQLRGHTSTTSLPQSSPAAGSDQLPAPERFVLTDAFIDSESWINASMVGDTNKKHILELKQGHWSNKPMDPRKRKNNRLFLAVNRGTRCMNSVGLGSYPAGTDWTYEMAMNGQKCPHCAGTGKACVFSQQQAVDKPETTIKLGIIGLPEDAHDQQVKVNQDREAYRRKQLEQR
ncbi:hypothetical protein BDZ85DRAFT_268269 [Elsinoe ampelina]|uniref:Uncharacterized protein n=1 Tax=Elsinoe ampelina TaxID=302913 RepID=A0A6A6G1Y0_9PEZI|nr:hypothetical protein BDZ85DRAFT_268269 [Elsinoe ampelina]